MCPWANRLRASQRLWAFSYAGLRKKASSFAPARPSVAAALLMRRYLLQSRPLAQPAGSGCRHPLFSPSATAALSSSAGLPAQERGGLFGVKGLDTPADFPRLAVQAAAEVEQLLALAVAGEANGTIRGGGFVGILDQMSDSICLVMDAAELCRNVHPDPAWKSASMASYETLAQLVARLNMDVSLYEALVRCIQRAQDTNGARHLLHAFAVCFYWGALQRRGLQIYIYRCIYVYIYVKISIYIYVSIYIYRYLYIYVYIYINMYI